MSIPKNAAASPPQVGQKVFLPELNVFGEIAEIYAEGGELIQTVKVLVSGKPTFIEATFKIVQAAENIGAIARLAYVVWGKIKAPLKALCKALRICKEKPVAVPPAVEVELERLAQAATPRDTAKWQLLRSKIAGLSS